MRPKLAEDEQMTIEEFLAFSDRRPDGERWELIEGVAIMNAAPTEWHQMIALNIANLLLQHKQATQATWIPLLGVGTRVPVSPRSLPQPDVYVQEGAPQDSPTTDDAVVLFEVLSPSNTKADQAWRKRVYSSVPNCQHYVSVATKSPDVVRYDRADGWKGVTAKGLAAKLTLAAIGANLPFRDIYRWAPIK